MTRQPLLPAGAGLVRDLRRGRERLWAFEPSRLEKARQSLAAAGAAWDQALGRLQRYVER